MAPKGRLKLGGKATPSLLHRRPVDDSPACASSTQNSPWKLTQLVLTDALQKPLRFVFPPDPDQVNWDSAEDDGEADGTLFRGHPEGDNNEEVARKDEENGQQDINLHVRRQGRPRTLEAGREQLESPSIQRPTRLVSRDATGPTDPQTWTSSGTENLDPPTAL